jgi:enoyl-CoA hydratase/carnithine racemase
LAVLQAEVPPDRARVLSLTGAVAEPGSPLLTGLIDEVVEPAALVDAATSQARSLAAKPAFARVKAQLRRATLERLRRIVEHDDEPLLQSWI